MPDAHATRPVDIVRQAIGASGGLGETWCIEEPGCVDESCRADVNAVRVGNLLLEIETDDLGWMLTAYEIADGEATPVAAVADESGNPVRALAAWLRSAAGPMNWTRVKQGLYRSGGFLVGQLDTGEWFAEGPGVDRCFDHKHDAQAACAAARSSPGSLPRRI